MANHVTCRICGETVSFSENQRFLLGKHLLLTHPEIEMTHFVFEDDAGDGIRQHPSNASETFTKLTTTNLKSVPAPVGNAEDDAEIQPQEPPKLHEQQHQQQHKKETKKKSGLYKTCVENWTAGTSRMECPNCNHIDQPYIRKQKNKIANNPIGAYCLLGCWPICFLPILFSGKRDVIVCCKKCGYCFGTYDQKTRQIIPQNQGAKIDIPNIC